MEEIHRPEIAPAAWVNMETEEFCCFELTRSNSGASSLTADNSKDLRQSANARLGKCVAWTNDQHNKYLDYLEASFVEQLGSLAWCKEEEKSGRKFSHKLPSNVHKASEQIQKINFEKDHPLSYIAATESLDDLKTPLVHHVRRAGRGSFMMSADLQECAVFHNEDKNLKGKRIYSSGPPSGFEENHLNGLCYHNSAGSIIEGTGQNFVDEDCEEHTSGVSRAKRLKTAVEDTSSKDQIVPSGNFTALDKLVVNNSTFEGEGEADHEGSENFSCFVILKDD